jgi:hypothetical protein
VTWEDLSSAELRARLTQRGLNVRHPRHLVANRDHYAAADDIDRILGDNQ